MIDKFVLLTPLIILPILLLFAFVGCALQTGGLPGPQATLIYHPDVLTQKNISFFTVTFTLEEIGSTAFPLQTAKKITTWSSAAAQDQITLDWPGGPTSASGSFNITCDVALFDNTNTQVSVNNNDAKASNLSGNNINAIFVLHPDISLWSAPFSLLIN